MKRSILPWPSAVAIQTMTLLPLVFLTIPVTLKMSGWLQVLLLSILHALAIADAAVFVLSFVKWWNRPVTMSGDGLQYGKGAIRQWADITSVTLVKKVRINYGGHLVALIVIEFEDGSKMRIEPYNEVFRCINAFCSDEAAFEKFDACLKGFERWTMEVDHKRPRR